MGRQRPVGADETSTNHNSFLVDIKTSTARIHDLHDAPPDTQQTARMAGQMPVSRETNTRASRLAAVLTKQGALHNPGQSNVQARGTTETATLRPAFGLRFYHFHGSGCGASRMDI